MKWLKPDPKKEVLIHEFIKENWMHIKNCKNGK